MIFAALDYWRRHLFKKTTIAISARASRSRHVPGAGGGGGGAMGIIPPAAAYGL